MTVETALLSAFAARLGPLAVCAYAATPWSSATFSGARHVFTLETDGSVDVDTLGGELAEAEIKIPRGFVADVAVMDRVTDDPKLITVEVLTIDA
jgi:hypothetical protein